MTTFTRRRKQPNAFLVELYLMLIVFVSSTNPSAIIRSEKSYEKIHRDDGLSLFSHNETRNITSFRNITVDGAISIVDKRRSIQEEVPLITIIFPMLGPRTTLYCMPRYSFENRTNEVVWINATNNWALAYYKEVSSDILEDMFISTEIRGYNESDAISEFDTQILYSQEILYRTRIVEENLVKKKHGFRIGFEPWSTLSLRNQFIEVLKRYGARAGTDSFDRVCGMKQSICFPKSPKQGCRELYPGGSPTNRPTSFEVRDALAYKSMGARNDKLDGFTEIVITLFIYDSDIPVTPTNTTPPIWNKAGTWQQQTSEFIAQWYTYNETVSNVTCTTTLLGTAREENLDSFYQRRSLTRATSPFKQSIQSRSMQSDRGTFVIYTQTFEQRTKGIGVAPPKVADLASTPLNNRTSAKAYVAQLQETISNSISSISFVNTFTPGPYYAYNVDNLVVAISPLRDLDDVTRGDFELAVSDHIKNYWTGERKWAAIFDLDVTPNTIVSRFEYSKSVMYVEYMIHFRYRSIYDRQFLDPQRVVSEPFKVEDGASKFLELLGRNNFNDRKYVVKFAGTVKEWSDFYPKKTKQNYTLLIISMCGIVSAAFFIMLLLLQTERLQYSQFLLEHSCDEGASKSPTIDIDSLGETDSNYSIKNRAEAVVRLSIKDGVGSNLDTNVDTKENERIQNRLLLENTRDSPSTESNSVVSRRFSSVHEDDTQSENSSFVFSNNQSTSSTSSDGYTANQTSATQSRSNDEESSKGHMSYDPDKWRSEVQIQRQNFLT